MLCDYSDSKVMTCTVTNGVGRPGRDGGVDLLHCMAAREVVNEGLCYGGEGILRPPIGLTVGFSSASHGLWLHRRHASPRPRAVGMAVPLSVGESAHT